MKANQVNLTNLLLKHEGGYSNHPNDKGGPTNLGITIEVFRKYIKPSGTIEDLKRLTRAQAIEVYDKRYWDALSCDDLPSGLDYAIYDYGVNSGVGRPPRVLAAVMGLPTGTPMKTLIVSARQIGTARLIDAICDERLRFMKSIRGGEDWKHFGKGWSRRVADVRRIAHSLIGKTAEQVKPVAGGVTDPQGKATTIDPKLPGKTAGGAVATTPVTGALAGWFSADVVTGIIAAVATVVIVGGFGYIIYKSQQKKQLQPVMG